ncbi:DUF6311 domain-containing protein [Candidatus Albibeggiatoa sp. nov. NOAA]|uniref:DUF6311 domain-containing protein n=1 Tax=Candidatus Albibeggiatoa sp. nov. NOAA TaxID=3162724 RepID=UPI0032FE164A|nr:DUF6311 domain-containing protein [Thiotrichaceae bacterium]
MKNQQIALSYLIILSLTAVLSVLFNLFISASQTDYYIQLEMIVSLGLLAFIFSAISFDYLTKLPPHHLTPLLGAAIGGLFFVNVLGLQIVNPQSVNWVMQGDLAHNYLGWQFFRQEPWQQPLGKISQFYYPMGSSVLYTDSLPLFALPLKLISDYLPAEFQYMGAWLLISYILQGVFAGLLMRLLTPNLMIQALGISFFVWMPALIVRVPHFTLASHWLLLAGLWLYFRTWSNPSSMRAFGAWLLLVAVSALTHPYLVIMVWALVGAFYLRWWLVDKYGSLFSTAAQVAILFAVTIGLWSMSGLFMVSSSQNLAAQGFGYYSMNLFSPLDSQQWSAFMRALPKSSPGQWEGFNYFGIGMWLLLLWAIYELKARPTKNMKVLWPLLLVCVVMTLLALSHKVTLLHWTIIQLPDEWVQYFTPFRSSGRFFWVTSYTLLFLALSALVTRNSVRTSFFLLTFAFVLQLVDLYPSHNHYRHITGLVNVKWDNPLKSPKWAQLAQGREQLLLIPSPNCGVEAAPYRPVAQLASQYQMLTNTGHTTRLDVEKSVQYCGELSHAIDHGLVESDALYIVNSDYLQRFQQNAIVPLDCQLVDNLWACVTAPQQASSQAIEHQENKQHSM